MPLQPVHAPQLLLVPPLLPPLVLRTENGFFGAKRPAIGAFGDCDPCTRFEEPPALPPDDHAPAAPAPDAAGPAAPTPDAAGPDAAGPDAAGPAAPTPDAAGPDAAEPSDPGPPVRYVKHQLHEAVDLEGEAGDCVFAVYTGRVVEVESSADGVRGDVTIDHHPLGTGLVSRYLHLEGASICVERGDSVTKGDVIGRIGSGPADPHLHLELRIVVDRSDRRYWSDRNSIALDPTRLLYRFEADAVALLPSGAAAAVTSIGIQSVGPVPLFRAQTDASPRPFSIPLYEPTTEHERGLAAMFTKALELGRPVEVEYRESVFFGDNLVPASVRLS